MGWSQPRHGVCTDRRVCSRFCISDGAFIHGSARDRIVASDRSFRTRVKRGYPQHRYPACDLVGLPSGTCRDYQSGWSFFGLGSAIVALLVAGTFNVYTVSSILFLVAIAPALFAVAFARTYFAPDPVLRPRSLKEVAREFTIPSAILFSFLLFCQFGNEWAIAGWLPLFLIVRLGLSPTLALIILAGYWLALMLGRLVAQAILPRVRHGRILVASVFASMLGCTILGFTDNLFGAVFGTLLVGFGFAPIYPLVVEKIGARFPNYHPGFFNGIFSIALTGGMLAPAVIGYASEYFGMQIVMLLPLAGSCVVLLLVLLVWLESRLLSPKL